MLTPKTQNDDYYAGVSAEQEAPKEAKKELASKLKIKVKKIETPVAGDSSVPTVAEPVKHSTPKPVAPGHDDRVPTLLKKAAAPTISFSPARPIVPKPVKASVPASSHQAPRKPGENRPAGGNQKPAQHSPAQPRTEEHRGPRIESDAPAQRLRAFADNENRLKTKGGPAISFSPATHTPRPQAPARPAQTGFSRPSSGNVRNSGFRKDAPPAGSRAADEKRYKTPKRSILRKPIRSLEDDDSFHRSKKIHQKDSSGKEGEVRQTLVDKTGQTLTLPDFLSVKEFSDKLGVPLAKVLLELMKNGVMANLNTKIDYDTCAIIAESFEIKIEKAATKAASAETVFEGNVADLLKDDDASKLLPRPPTVTIMGHVNHGKTTLLDYIRSSKIASGEAGGITQSIGAYQAEQKGKKITFLDTPGHEAFSLMRSRGVRMTDLVVLVVAADEGVKPQTIESIKLAQTAGVQVIVAINKVDKPGANLQLVQTQLSEHGLQPEAWGGTTPCIPVSAHSGQGMDELLDMILLAAEVGDWKANPDRAAIATVVESHLDPSQGPVATVLVNAGTLRKGDAIVSGSVYGRIKSLKDFRGKSLQEAIPGTPAFVSGLSGVVRGGDLVQGVKNSATAAAMAHEYELLAASKSFKQFEGASLVSLLAKIKAGALKQLKMVVKSDTNGSLEALRDALSRLASDKVQIQIVHAGVGPINENDVLMAGTGQALLIGYNVDLLPTARESFEKTKIELISDRVIYRILDRVNQIATGMVDVEKIEQLIGEAIVKKVFYDSKELYIIGLGVTSGKIRNKVIAKAVRNDRQLGTGKVASLKHGVDAVNELESGNDCGIAYEGEYRPKEGDILEFYEMVVRQ